MRGVIRFIFLSSLFLPVGAAPQGFQIQDSGAPFSSKNPVTQTPGAPSEAQPQASTTASTQASAAKRKLSADVKVSAAQPWIDTGIDLAPGDKVQISADGALDYLGQKATPDGLIRGWKDLLRALPVNSAGLGALVARQTNDPASVPFLIGSKHEFSATQPGRLFLGVNQTANDASQGDYNVKIKVVPGQASSEPVSTTVSFDPALLHKLPRRVTDQQGHPGDMVNFLLLGSEARMKAAFEAGGWVPVDKTHEDAVLHAVLATLSKKAYTEMPMSELYLFGRSQDFGFARADPIEVVASRHHLRVWKAPFEVDGQTLWVGAATHDVGFEKDNRTGGLTHKIDANVDQERDFVAASLAGGGSVMAKNYLVPTDPLREASTATGGSFHSDGRILVMQLGR